MPKESHKQDWSVQIDHNLVESVETFGDYSPSTAVSVIVLTYNRPDDVLQCLDALRLQTCQDFEIILVDNNSDELPDLSAYPVKLVKLKENLGPGTGRNYGVAHSDAKVVVFLDDDSVPDTNLVEIYAKAFVDNAVNYAARGRVLLKDPTIYSTFEPVFDLGEKPTNAFLTTESNVAVCRDHFEDVGGWETTVTCHEGLVLSYRLVQRFGREGMLYLPDAAVLHDTVKTLREHLFRRIRFASTREVLFARMPELTDFAATRTLPPTPPAPRNPITKFRLHCIRQLTRIVMGPPSRKRSFVMWALRLRDK